jgi:hypothetical protein
MKFSITFDEIEAFIKAHYDLELELRHVSDYEIKIQPRNMGLFQNRVKVHILIDSEYEVPNRVKMNISAGILSPVVVPKILTILNELPECSVATNEDGNIIIFLDKLPQLSAVCSACEIINVCFCKYTNQVEVSARFSEESGVKPEDFPKEDGYSFNSNVSLKEQEEGRNMGKIARSIFESDKIDEWVQTLKDKTNELRDTNGEELKDAALSLLKKFNPK